MAKKLKAEDLPYRPCVGIMVLNQDGLVWAGKRIPNNDRDEYKDEPFKWQMPQGGVDPGSFQPAARTSGGGDTGKRRRLLTG